MSVPVITPDQMRSLESYIFDAQKVPSMLLMETAGHCVFEAISAEFKADSRVLVLCGTGNNGGDGLVCARLLALAGFKVEAVVLGALDSIKGDARIMVDILTASSFKIDEIKNEDDFYNARFVSSRYDFIVDAIFGIGLNREISGVHSKAIDWANAQCCPIFSIDIPSGICSSDGKVLGHSIKAYSTITFQYPKPGHLFHPGRECSGKLVVKKIFLDSSVESSSLPRMQLMVPSDLKFAIKRRSSNSHKGDYGKALIIAGSSGLSGAAIICSRAALRTGAGLLSLAVPKSIAPSVWSALPEVMAHPVDDLDGIISLNAIEKITEMLTGKTCAAIGPGIGRATQIIEIIKEVLNYPIPVVLDADALHAISQNMSVLKDCRASVVLTPHASEMAKLCDTSIENILSSPIEQAKKLAQESNATVLLKGSTSVICSSKGEISLNISGGPQLAKGGSGDILTGIILALMSNGLNNYDAVRHGALLLGLASSECCANENSMIASDIVESISLALNRFSR